MNTATIQLDQFLKLQRLVGSGGEAKVRIQSGEVLVNNAIETRRGRQLHAGDVITFNGKTFPVTLESLPEAKS